MNEKRLAITGLIRKHCIQQPEKIAIIVSGFAVSYRELYRMITSAATFFSSVGIGRGSHVLTMANPSIEYVVCEYALLGLGAVHIPVENRAPVDRIADIAQLIDAELIISPEKPPCDLPWLNVSDVDMNSDINMSWKPVSVTDDCTEIIFTTGTTGKSKGVMLSSHCLDVYLNAINTSFMLNKESVLLVTTPLNHVGGLHRVHQCMASGCTAILMDGIRNLKAFFSVINEYGVTHTYLPPASIKMLLTLARKQLAELNGKLEFIYTASAPFPTSDIETLMDLLPDTRLYQGYGSSETGSVCNCQYNVPGEVPNCLGKPYPCVEVKLIDENGNKVTEPYKEGFLCSRSDMNMLGYYKEPELTAEILKDGYIYSKDLMYFDEQGGLHFAGRGDDVINIRGFKVAPTEIEDVVQRFENVLECVCIPFDDNNLGKCLKLFVVMKKGSQFDMEKITSFLNAKLEAYKVPRYIEAIEKIPRTYNGKVDRKRLILNTSNAEESLINRGE